MATLQLKDINKIKMFPTTKVVEASVGIFGVVMKELNGHYARWSGLIEICGIII